MPRPRVRSVLVSRLAGRRDAAANGSPGGTAKAGPGGTGKAGPGGTAIGSSQGEIRDELRRCILDGEVPPGSPIPVDGVAAAFGVSRIPVREALMTLIGEGLVDHRPHSGYRVAKMTAGEFGEIYLVREALETAGLRVAVELADERDDELARAAHAALGDAVRAGDGRGHHLQSRRFHLALIEPCRMRRLLHMLSTAWNMTEPLQPMSHFDAAERALLHRDHDAMLAAFTARDGAALVELCGVHHRRLQGFIARLPQHTGLFHEEIYNSAHPAETPRS